LSATVPSFSWKVIRFSPSACCESVFFLSCCQKKLASDRRAARTLRFPATMPAPPSVAAMLAVQTKALARLPSFSQTKYFWLDRAVSWMTSGGTYR